MKITEQQSGLLASLRCERLSSNEQHLRDVGTFRNNRNENLANYICGEAYQDDEEGKIANYLIKAPTGEILFYFSLKCGLLFDRSITDEEIIKLLKDLLSYFIRLKDDPTTTESDKQTIDSIFEKLRTQKGFTKADLQKIKIKKNKIIENIEEKFDSGMQRVGETYAGIEIVNFCANDNDECRNLWKGYGLGQKLGVVVFWYFIVPIILDTMKLIGCQYLFLFAADFSEDEDLVNYYRTNLKFIDSLDRSTTIPLYDQMCKFMYQETSCLAANRTQFFDNFNREEDAI